MIQGIGTDLVFVPRILASWTRHGDRFVQRILTEAEQQRWRESKRPEYMLAKCFAAKEAVSKALGTGISQGISWQHIELGREPSGKPLIRLREAALNRLQALDAQDVLISLSDEKDYVLAFAVLTS